MFCSKCGHKLEDGAKFCDACGTKVADEEVTQEAPVVEKKEQEPKKHIENPVVKEEKKIQPEQKQDNGIRKEGTIHKCPACGEVIKGFEMKCPSCGFEFRDTKSSNTITEFANRIQYLEDQRKEKTIRRRFGEEMLTYIGVTAETDKIDREIITLIKNFPIPNNKEDIYEFLILACSNIDEEILKAHDNLEVDIPNVHEFNALRSRSKAWLAKATQAYQKAQIGFANTEQFKQIDSIYKEKLESTKQANKQRKTKKVFWIVFPVALLGTILIVLIALGLLSD